MSKTNSINKSPLMNKSKSKKEWLQAAQTLPTSGMSFTSLSGEEVDLLYTPEDTKDIDYDKEIGVYRRAVEYALTAA